MPEIGEIKRGREIGKNTSRTAAKRNYIWSACIICGRERWVEIRHGEPRPRHERCNLCSPQTWHLFENRKPAEPPSGEPKIGEIRRGKDIGQPSSRNCKFVWRSCPDCSKERWVRIDEPADTRCQHCSIIRTAEIRAKRTNPFWQYGRFLGVNGYAFITRSMLTAEEEALVPSNKNTIAEHRLVMAKHLNRPLQSYETVHHVNGDRTDNRIENLELITPGPHRGQHPQCRCPKCGHRFQMAAFRVPKGFI